MIGTDLKPKARALLVNFIILAFSACAGLFLAELIARIAFPQNLILRRPDVWYPVEGLGWNRAPNLDTMVNFGGAGPVRLITDAEGNRIGRVGRVQSPAIRILAIGDSFVEALQVEYEQTMTYLLQEETAKQTGLRTEIQCAGVGGWGPNQYLLQAQAKLASAKFDMQLVFFYFGNDVEKEKVEKYPRRHPAPYHRLRWPGKLNSGEIIDAFFYPINDWLETRAQAFILFRNRMQSLLARLGLTAISIPFNIYRSAADKEWWDITADICREIEMNGTRYGIPTIFILIPPDNLFVDAPLEELGYDPATMDLTQPYRLMKPKLEAKGLQIVDLMLPFKERLNEGVRCYGDIDSHLNAEGHRIAAKVILPYVLAQLHKHHETFVQMSQK